MNKVYKIKRNHEIVEFIRQEIENSWGKKVGISDLGIYDRALCGGDIYGLSFNANNWDVLTINVGVYTTPIVENPPTNLTKLRGYDYYKYSTNCSIKLKTFLDRNPQWSKIDEWADLILLERKKCRYSGHNNKERRFNMSIQDGVNYIVSFPENEPDDKNLLEWTKPLEEILSVRYHRELGLDRALNIKRNKSVYVDGIWFKYDYFDGDVEICGANVSANDYGYSYKSIFNLFTPKPETLDKIAEEIRGADLEVKSVKFVEPRSHSKDIYLKYEDI